MSFPSDPLPDRCREAVLSVFFDLKVREVSNDVLLYELRSWVPELRADPIAAQRALTALYDQGYLFGVIVGPGGVATLSEWVLQGPGSLPPSAGACAQCGVGINPVESALGPICGKCCRRNYRALASSPSTVRSSG